ncbi:MAG: hypothetical protein AB7G75_21090 [Candidatus Binatia bacterium]
MMETVATLIGRTRQRLVRQRQLNILGVLLPLFLAGGWFCWVLFRRLALPPLLIVLPVFLCLVYLVVTFQKIKKAVAQEIAASLLDEKTKSQERFLTVSSLLPHLPPSSLLPLLQQQAELKAAEFQISRDLPFSLDRRVFVSLALSTLCILALTFLPPLLSVSPPEAAIPTSTSLPSLEDIEKLEELARTLLRPENSPQEQKAGEELLTLAKQLQDPTRSPEEKQRLIEDAQQRLQLSLPELLPLDLKLFANESKQDSGEGNKSNQAQQEGKSQAKSNQSPEQQGQSSSDTNQDSQSGSQEGKQDKPQPQPKESGGGIKFDQPQQKDGKKTERPDQNMSGEQQQAAQNQNPQTQAPGSDPNQPGGQNSEQQDPEKKGQTPDPQRLEQEQRGKGSTLSGGRGERFSQPGEQPGGFLTTDARFVKVRVPRGTEPHGKGDILTENYAAAQPKTPYSNVPLKDAPSNQSQPQQPIPLEYRSILK